MTPFHWFVITRTTSTTKIVLDQEKNPTEMRVRPLKFMNRNSTLLNCQRYCYLVTGMKMDALCLPWVQFYIAIDRTTKENGCLNVILVDHNVKKTLVKFLETSDDTHFPPLQGLAI